LIFQERFTRQVTEFEARLDRLSRLGRQADQTRPDDLLAVLQELETAAEELRAADAELAIQAEKLQRTHLDLELERQRYAALFNFAPDGYLVTDAYGVIREANQAAAELLGARAARLVGKPLAAYVPPARASEFRRFLLDLAAAAGQARWEGVVKPRKDPPAVVEFRVAVSRDENTGQVSELRWRLHDISETKALQAEQATLLGGLRELAARLEAVREHEQARLARQVHDEIGGALSAIKMDLAHIRDSLPTSAENAALHARLADTVLQAEQAAQSARNIATELRPAVLDRLGLVAAVGWQLEQFEQRSGITCQIKVSSAASAVPAPIAEVVFRVYQELLTNVARHAQATRVVVRLAQEGGHLILEVRDNGIGISRAAGAAVSSLGLLGSRERLLEFGGTLEVQPARGKGTLARLAVPLPPAP
jgi:PAS domain S-box-containing protein